MSQPLIGYYETERSGCTVFGEVNLLRGAGSPGRWGASGQAFVHCQLRLAQGKEQQAAA